MFSSGRHLITLLLLVIGSGFAQYPDRAICNKIFSFAFEHKLYEKPIGDVAVAIGEEFLHAPYEAHTLDRSPKEDLIINLHSFDCVTFVENVLALSCCVKKNRLSYEEFQHHLQVIRYRRGDVSGYASRLHYFTDWIYDGERKGVVRDMTKQLGGAAFVKKIDFMTSHRTAYPRLNVDSTFITMKRLEDTLSQRTFYYIPKNKINLLESGINNGDIIAITTNKEGLDVSHVGIAVRLKNGTLHYMHAPNEKGEVKITRESLFMHLRNTPSQTGIIVARPLETEDK